MTSCWSLGQRVMFGNLLHWVSALPSAVSVHLPAGRDMYFVCHVTPQDRIVGMSCIYMNESSLQHAATMKIWVIIGILIVKRKNASSKTRTYKYILPLKNWVDCITTRQEKNVATSKMHIMRRGVQKLKNIFPLMTTFYNFTLDSNQLS